MSVITEGRERKVRMAHLAIVGTPSTNGVAAIHSELLRTKVVPDFVELFPRRFNNKTKGLTRGGGCGWPTRTWRGCSPTPSARGG